MLMLFHFFISCSSEISKIDSHFDSIVEVKISSIDTGSFLKHILYYGVDLKTNQEIYLISEKDSNISLDIYNENIQKIYSYIIYRFKIQKAPPDIAMWYGYPRISGFGIENDIKDYKPIWFNGKFEVDVYTSPNIIDKYYIK